MQFTKPMIELVFEIRRFSPSELKPSVKLANPELFSELQTYYHDTANTISKALIKELFHLAGDPWPKRLELPTEVAVKQTLRIYRGQVQLEDKPVAEPETAAAQQKRKTRIYRGQVVYE